MSDTGKIEPACSNCKHLKECKYTTENLLRMGFQCSRWEIVPDAVLDAREDIIDDFGLWALRYEVPSVTAERAPKIKPRRRRYHV